jgi:hypothetical protein
MCGTDAFHPRQWLPPGMTALHLLTGTGAGAGAGAAGAAGNEDGAPAACYPDLEQELGQKMLADLFESVVGAVLTGASFIE